MLIASVLAYFAVTIAIGLWAAQRVPVRGGLRVRGLDDVLRSIEVLAIPLEGQGGRRAGAAAVFWEQPL